ncbi:MAG: phosphoglucomutase/phosphomannomutase PgmG [Alphaproteobacteria bacterium]
MLSSAIFREYDIRGIPGDNFTYEDAYAIARAFAARIEGEKPFVCLGRDGRLSSPQLAESIRRGLLDSGVDVIDIGIGPTPMLYYAAHSCKASAAIMVTGSHNPPTHNGMKCMLHGKPFFGEDIRALHAAVEAGKFKNGAGALQHKDVRADYTKELLHAYHGNDMLNIAWDAGNGAAGEIMTRLCQQLPGQHIVLNGTIDGRFPNHHPDPSVAENLRQLVAAVRENKCQLGIAFDGDADRIGVVDDEGFVIWPDQLMILYARAVLAENPGSMIIADVKSSDALFEDVKAHGGQPLMWKTGHSHIKAKLAETGAKLAGEMSGHIFFADRYYGYDDALYAAVRLLSIVSQQGGKLSAWRKLLPEYVNTPEIRFECEEDRKFAVIEEVRARLENDKKRFTAVDGVRVHTKDGWWLLRASNTQPVLVARCEARTQEGLDRLVDALKEQLMASAIDLPSA